MKTSIKIGAALLLAGILIAITLPRKAGAQNALAERIRKVNEDVNQRTQPVQVVILESQDAVSYGPVYHGIEVYNSSSSAGAPTFPHYPEVSVGLADAIATLIGQGFEMVPGHPNMFVKRIKAQVAQLSRQ